MACASVGCWLWCLFAAVVHVGNLLRIMSSDVYSECVDDWIADDVACWLLIPHRTSGWHAVPVGPEAEQGREPAPGGGEQPGQRHGESTAARKVHELAGRGCCSHQQQFMNHQVVGWAALVGDSCAFNIWGWLVQHF